MNAIATASTEGSRISETMQAIRYLLQKHAPMHLKEGAPERRRWVPFLAEEKQRIKSLWAAGWQRKELIRHFNRTDVQIRQAIRS